MHKPIQESEQYSPRSIRRYERIFGPDFLSSGGPETTRTICETLDIRPGTRVLDVGSGLGGSAFHMNRVYGAIVTGVDILPQMIALSTERAAAYGTNDVNFVEGDILTLDLPAASFDLVYSRDAFLYIKDKLTLFRKLFQLLGSRGRLFVSDYGRGPDPLSDEFVNYANGAGYSLEEPDIYGSIVKEAGFGNVKAEDMTAAFIAILQREIASVRSGAVESDDGLDQEDRDYLIERWERKIRWCKAGEMRWIHVIARRN